MIIKAITSDQTSNIQIPHFKQDQLANKINNWVVFGYMFLAIGSIAALVATGGFVHLFTLTQAMSDTIVGIAAYLIFMGGASIVKGLNDKKYKAIEYDPKDFGISGIKNTNNNCWLNALLQVLLNSETIREKLLQQNRTFRRFIDKYEAAVKGDPEFPNSQPLRNFLNGICSTITTDDEFQDSHEPLTAILDMLRNTNSDFRNTLETKNHYEYENGIKETSVSQEANNGIINLPLFTNGKKYTIPDLIREYFHSVQNTKADITLEIQRTVENDCLWGLWKRDKVITETIMQKRNMVLEQRKLQFAPKTLFFNVQRYFSNPDIDIPFNLSMDKKYFGSDQRVEYRLKGFACHVNDVHYISYIESNGIWFSCNDSCVKVVSQAEAENAARKAYILHYEKL